jgi:hypothetical protein
MYTPNPSPPEPQGSSSTHLHVVWVGAGNQAIQLDCHLVGAGGQAPHTVAPLLICHCAGDRPRP